MATSTPLVLQLSDEVPETGTTTTAVLLGADGKPISGAGSGAKGDKGDPGAAAPTITGIAIDAAAGKATLTLSDNSTVEGTYTAA